MNKDDSIPSFSLELGLSQLDSQSLVPHSTSVPDPKTTGKKHDANEEDDDGAPLIFPMRNTSQANGDLSIKNYTENKSKAGDKPSSKKGDVRNPTIRIKKPTMQQTSSSKALSPHIAKDQPQKDKQVLSLKAQGKQPQSENVKSTPPAKDKSTK